MAEAKEVRHAGIGLDLSINGLDDFKRANSMMDDFLETMKEASRITDKFKNNFSGFGGKSSDEVRKTRDAVQDVYHSMDSAKNETNQVTENVHKMQQEFKHTSDAAKKIKLNSGLNSDINKSAEEVKKLAKSADQSGNKFKEMFRKLRSGSSESNGSFSKLHDSAKKTFDEVHKGTHFLRDVVTASFISNAAINTWYSLKSGIGSALKAGEEYDKEQQVMHATWNTLTDSSVKGNRMVKAINSMSVSFGQSAGLVNELNQQFYHVLDKQGPTDRLTKSVLTMADTLGMGAENTKRLGLNFTHMMASSKMQLGDFNMISDQLPMFGSKLLAYERKAMDNSHLTMSQLRKDMTAGKISAKDAENVMNSLGKKYAEASENMMKTLPGMERVMSARGAALFGALEKPFMKAKNPIFGAISKWVSEKKTENEFTKVGTAASKGLNTITQSFAKVFNPKESPHLANDVMNNIAKGVTSVSNTIAHHAKSIVEFFKSLYYTVKILKDVGVGFAKGLVSGLSAIVTPIGKLAGNSKKIHSFSDALKSITTHKKGLEDIGKLLAGIWGTSKAMKGISFAKNMVGKTTRMFIKPEIDPKTGKHELTLFSKAIRSTTKGIGKSLRWTAKLAYKGVVKGLSVIKTAAIATGKGFKLAFNFLKANPFIAIITGAIAVGAALYELYKHNKKFREFVNGLISWAKKAWEGVTKWFGKLANGVRKYINYLVKDVNKRWGWLFNDMAKIIKDAWRTIKSLIQVIVDVFTGKWGRLVKDIGKLTKNLWNDVKDRFKIGFDSVNKLTGGRLEDTIKLFSNAWHSIGRGWKSFWNGISDWFGDLWKGIVKHVKDGINNVIKVLNSGISGIDSVIHAFGGSSKAIGTINPVHLATGTGALSGQRRAITKPTMAMLNDGHDSPETGNREMLIHPNGMSELIKGTNVKRLLEPGAEILNASETKFALSLNGMSHFAKGTGLLGNLWNGAKSIGSSVVGGVEKGFGAIGNFAGGVVKATKKVFDTVKSIVKDPSKYLTGLLKKPSGKGTVLSDFANGFFGKMKSSATNWWKSLWGMVNLDGGSGGDATGLLAAVEKYGRGKRYVWGAAGPNTFDCSGLVMYALKHAFGIDYPHYSGAQYGKTKHISRSNAKPGDLVFWGPGKHVGVFAGGNKYWSAFAPNGHPDIGMHSISGSVPGYSPLFGEVRGLARKTASKGKKSASNSIQSLIKKQVGSGFFKFMSKLANKFGDNAAGSYGNPAGDGVSRWRKYVVKALKANGFSASPSQISAWMRVIARESNGNPKAINNWDSNAKAGHPSKGLVQTIDSTFNSYKFKGHGQIYNGFDDLLAGINYMKHIYGKGASAFARVSGPEGYAKGGHINRNKLSIVGEKGWELFKPDTAGTVIPHEASEKIFNGQNKKVSIDARTNLTIQGHADSSTINKIDERIEKRNNDLVEKMRQLLGSNDEGGLTV
ncbi:tape measure protein [Lentilactobacillus buchneri]|uniref:tape measure protein n=1 Tax=Lentilactobacillus buchneri TaxID=1581 RepID=UPI0020C1293D|nr:NlpC/P60 family protein [Lentilactobacillus buchneri]